MFSSFSGCFGNTDTRTRNSNSLTVPCRDNFAQHSQDHTSTTSHQENNLTQYLIVTLRDFFFFSPGVTIFEGSLPLSKHDLHTLSPQIFGLPFGISQVCYLDDHTLPRRKKPCLVCQVILPHSSRTLLRQFCWGHFPYFIPHPSILHWGFLYIQNLTPQQTILSATTDPQLNRSGALKTMKQGSTN